MNDSNFDFASNLVKNTLSSQSNFVNHPKVSTKVQTNSDKTLSSTLDLTPFRARAMPVSAYAYFNSVTDSDELIKTYNEIKSKYPFEINLRGVAGQIIDYSHRFLDDILQQADALSELQIKLVVNFIKNLDIYCAIKAIESLLNSQADIALLEVAHKNNWHVHFDHLAIRCGSRKYNDAAAIAQYLIKEHQYLPSQVSGEAHYQFPDGWNAFPLYKILENGQVLRLFVDQSDVTDKNQIIQHWNRVYGYTAHHLALRATENIDGNKREVPLEELMTALQAHGVTILTPTGERTHGLLLQVFTKPEINNSIPLDIRQSLRDKGNNLENTIKNGKLLEIVSRKEMPLDFAKQLFNLYELDFDANDPLHTAPIYTYFLPTQAAHVIKTSQKTNV